MQETLRTTRCARQAGAAVLVLSCAWAFAGDLHAQAADVMPTPSRVREVLERPAAGPAIWALPSPDLAPIGFEHGLPGISVELNRGEWFAPQIPIGHRQPRIARKRAQGPNGRAVAGAVIGMLGGLWAGGRLGILIEGDSCRCDDPGLKGWLIGAPIGAVAGAVAGAVLLR